jgi:hypothetical protein
MSHFTEVKLQMKDVKVFRTCLEKMGYTITAEKTIRGYGSTKQSVDLAIKISDNSYPIGLRRGTDNNFEVVADWWGVKGTNEKEFVNSLRKMYTEEQTQVFARGNRFTVNKTVEGKKTRLELVRRTY